MAKKKSTKRYSRDDKPGYRDVTPETYDIEPMKKRKYYPMITLDLKDIPEAEAWKIGSKYEIKLVGTMKGMYKNENKTEVTFEIRKVDGEEAYKSK